MDWDSDVGLGLDAFMDFKLKPSDGVYGSYWPISAGGTHAAKVAYGSYVGVPDVPFGSTAHRT
jgi:hypothetical protein